MKISNQKNKNDKKGQLRRKGYVIFLLVAVCCLLGGLLARYVHETRTGTSQITAENFYFTANLLGDTRMVPVDGQSQESYAFGEKSTEGTWNLYGSSAHSIKIQVQNYYDALRITERGIQYNGSVTVQDAKGNEITQGSAEAFPELKKGNEAFSSGTLQAGSGSSSGSDANSGTSDGTGDDASNGTGDGTGNDAANSTGSGNSQKSEELTLAIPGSGQWDYEDGTTVIVKIASTSPYKKTVTLKFVLYTTDTTLQYKVIDSVGSPYAELILMTDVPDAVQPYLQWSDELSIDNNNPLTFTYDDKGTFTQQPGMENRNMQVSRALKTGESESIYFFKADTSKDYSQSETIVVPSSDSKYVVNIGMGNGN